MKDQKDCESCFYYVIPGDAPEYAVPECTYVPAPDDEYMDYTLPCEK